MRLVASLILAGVLVYALVLGLVYARQRSLLYPASALRVTAAEAGLAPAFQDVSLTTEDGERLVGWYRAPEPGKAVVLYFHGNGGSLLNRCDRAKLLTEGGRGLLIVGYRGYSGSTGTPTEAGLHRDARAAYGFLAVRYPGLRIVLYGESLGSGVAVPLAAERPVGGVVLDAPFASAAEVARAVFWYLPVDWLMLDPYRTIDRVGALKAPLLVLHGEGDGVVPITQGERLYAAAPEPKRFVRIAGGDHERNLESAAGSSAVRAFLGEVEARLEPVPEEATTDP